MQSRVPKIVWESGVPRVYVELLTHLKQQIESTKAESDRNQLVCQYNDYFKIPNYDEQDWMAPNHPLSMECLLEPSLMSQEYISWLETYHRDGPTFTFQKLVQHCDCAIVSLVKPNRADSLSYFAKLETVIRGRFPPIDRFTVSLILDRTGLTAKPLKGQKYLAFGFRGTSRIRGWLYSYHHINPWLFRIIECGSGQFLASKQWDTAYWGGIDFVIDGDMCLLPMSSVTEWLASLPTLPEIPWWPFRNGWCGRFFDEDYREVPKAEVPPEILAYYNVRP